VHKNGSYPSVNDWESLHSKNVQRAQSAAQNGSDLEFFGDSITEAMGWNPAAMQPFKNNFGADNPTALGLGGDGTQQLLYRLNHGEMQGTPKAVVLNIGTNDLGSLSTEQIANNIQKSIESIQLRSPDSKIVLMGILPRTDAGDPGNAMVDATNAALSKLATTNGAVQFVNLRNSFVDSNGNQKAELYNTDKLHLSPAGYQAWADGIRNAIGRINSMPATPSRPGSDSGSHSGAGNGSSGNSGSGDSGSGSSGNSGSGTGSGDSGNWGDSGSGNSGSGDSGNWGGNSDSGDSSTGDSGHSDAGDSTPEENVGSPLMTLDTAHVRGVNLSGAEWGKGSSSDTKYWPTEQELDYYKSKGMNTVRLMLSWEQLQPKLGGPLDTAEMNRLKNFLREADERGIKVLVTGGSFARYTLNHGAFGAGADGEVNGTKVGDSGVPISAMADFWTKMVNEINSDPAASKGVGGWDLTNEPHTMNGTWPQIAIAVDKAIRATGDQHTIVVEGDQWARDFSGLEELARIDKNVAFEAHSYWDDGSGGYANMNPPANANVGVDHIKPFVEWLKKNNAKGFVGEWGVPTNNTAWAPAVRNFIDYLDANNMGNMVWAGGPGWGADYKLSVEPINGQDRAIMKTIVEANAS
jgi:Lysophospholipase L1 and related esterases